MQINFENFNKNEIRKSNKLIKIASNLDLEFNHAYIDVNSSSGYVYYYSEDYNFSIGISLNDCVYIVWSNFETGEEEFLDYSEDLTLEKIENWVIDCYKKHELYEAIA